MRHWGLSGTRSMAGSNGILDTCAAQATRPTRETDFFSPDGTKRISVCELSSRAMLLFSFILSRLPIYSQRALRNNVPLKKVFRPL